MSTQELTIMVFGQLTDITGTGKITVPVVFDLDSLRELLLKQYPKLSAVSYVIAIDKKIATGNTGISPASGIALLPPFSGG